MDLTTARLRAMRGSVAGRAEVQGFWHFPSRLSRNFSLRWRAIGR